MGDEYFINNKMGLIIMIRNNWVLHFIHYIVRSAYIKSLQFYMNLNSKIKDYK